MKSYKENVGFFDHLWGGITYKSGTALIWIGMEHTWNLALVIGLLVCVGLLLAIEYELIQLLNTKEVEAHGGLKGFLEDAASDMFAAVLGGSIILILAYILYMVKFQYLFHLLLVIHIGGSIWLGYKYRCWKKEKSRREHAE